MMPLLLRKKSISMKKELWIVLGVLLGVLLLPVIALTSITNVSALVGSGPDGGRGSATLYTDPAYARDLYDSVNCTSWAAMRRAQVGEPVPHTWGHAATWAVRDLLGGYKVDNTPTPYAIMRIPNVINGLGHVSLVGGV